MKNITSSNNPTIKNLRLLYTSSKARRDQGQTILEGIHLAQAWLALDQAPLLCVVSDIALDNIEVTEIVRTCQKRGYECIEVPVGQFKSFSSLDNGIGIALLIKVPTHTPIESLNESTLLIDGIQDPGNLGTMLRTSVAAGLKSVYISPNSVAAWSPRVLRAGMGAHFGLKIYENSDLAKVIETSKIPVLATVLGAEISVYELDLTIQTAWIFGSEGQGVNGDLLSLSPIVKQIYIPQSQNVESLNVAAATAVCLFEQVRQKINLEL